MEDLRFSHDWEAWADDLIQHLPGIKSAVAEAVAAHRDTLTPRQLQTFLTRYQTIIPAGLAANPVATIPPAPKNGGG
ncbi:MAG: hypothetical protein M0Z53_02000 [Thermaerobacter sp.]|nr:hypothetical protein [Thermaerobacter sp.]